MFKIYRDQWYKKCKNTVFFIVLGSVVLSAQSKSNRFFSSGSEIVVDVLPGNDIYYSHRCDEGITIYNLAEVFQLGTEQLLRENKINPKNPKYEGKIVKIPLSKSLIVTNPTFKPAKQNHLKIMYRVKKGDNLYKIAKEYFDTNITSLATINGKKTYDVKLGEVLLIGWFLIKETPNKTMTVANKADKTEKRIPSKQENKIESVLTKSDANQRPDTKDKDDDIKIVKFYLSDVIGFWDKSSANNKSYFVLHNVARPGSMMDVYNPMLKRHIKAKVLGKIPTSAYSQDVQIIISPSVAKELGILDGRFKVNIKYEE